MSLMATGRGAGIFGNTSREYIDTDTGQITWMNRSGQLVAQPPAIVGSYSPQYQEFQQQYAVANDGTFPGQPQSAVSYIDPSRATSDPRGVLADVIRGQWDDFSQTALPVKRDLEAMTTYAGNPGVVGALKDQARTNAQTSFGNMVNDAQRETQSYGMSLSPTSQTALTRAAKLGMAAATTDGVNRANDFQQDLNRQIVSGASLSGGRNYT